MLATFVPLASSFAAPDASFAPEGASFAATVDDAAHLSQAEGLSCHARDHLDLSGDAAFVWGLGFRVKDAGECCKACAAHQSQCSRKRSRGEVWWRGADGRKHTCSGGRKTGACNAWVFCAGDPTLPHPAKNRCFSYDIHNHTRGECWLKHEPNPANPIAAGPSLPRAMRDAPRKEWPWSVSEKLWPWPVPELLTWQSGIVAPQGEAVWQSTKLPGWHKRFCNSHAC